jgi:hypothetical protein
MNVDPSLTERLNRASVRRRFYPFDGDVVDWSVPRTDDWLYMPREISIFRTAPELESLSPRAMSFLTRYEVTQTFRNIAHGEHLLCQGLLSSLWTLDRYEPDFRYLLHEVAEECQHMMMFAEWVRVNGDIRTTGIGEARFLPVGGNLAASVFAAVAPEIGWVMILFFEAIGDLINETLRSADDIHPTLKQMGHAHTVEEIRHLAYAKAWLKSAIPALSPARRRFIRSFTERLAALTLRRPRFLPIPYGEQLAPHLDRATFRRVRRAPEVTAAFRAQAWRSMIEMREVGLLTEAAIARLEPLARAS